jgi:hypothetical protein
VARFDRQRESPRRNLTTQLRSHCRRGHGGDEGRPDTFDSGRAQGEVAFVKDNINEMIRNLKDTTLQNEEQDG